MKQKLQHFFKHWFAKFKSIKGRLSLLVLLLVTIIAAGSWNTWRITAKSALQTNSLVQLEVPSAIYESDLNSAVNLIAFWIQNALLNVGNPELVKKSFQQVDLNIERYKKAIEVLQTVPWDQDKKMYFDWIMSGVPDFDGMIVEVRKDIENFKGTDPKEIEQFRKTTLEDKVLAKMGSVTGPLETLGDMHKSYLKEFTDGYNSDQRNLKTTTIAFALIGTLVAIIFGLFLRAVITKTLNSFTERLEGSSVHLHGACGELTNMGLQLTQGSNQSSESLTETSSALDEVASIIQKNADFAVKASEASRGNKDHAVEGKKIVQEVVRAIEEVRDSSQQFETQVEQNNADLQGIAQVIAQIGEKTKVINDIVFQTRLLAFNASVEAARAGEHGKGFSVVAQEVGNLASMAGSAAKSINEILTSGVGKVQDIVHTSQDRFRRHISETSTKINHSIEVTERCADLFDQIVVQVENVTNMAEEIASASREQSHGIAEVSKAVHLLNTITSSNLKHSESVEDKSKDIYNQADSLKVLSEELEELVHGNTSDPHQEAA